MSTVSKISAGPAKAPRPLRGRIYRWLLQVSERSRQRHALMNLSDEMLKDIGLTRHEAAAEATKPFWRL